MVNAPATVVETPEFLAACSGMIPDGDRMLLIDYLAYNPLAGDVIQGTGGIRKLRWALAGRGKSGGARVIYFYHNAGMPLFMLTAYAKNQRSDLSPGDRKELKASIEVLVKTYRRNHK